MIPRVDTPTEALVWLLECNMATLEHQRGLASPSKSALRRLESIVEGAVRMCSEFPWALNAAKKMRCGRVENALRIAHQKSAAHFEVLDEDDKSLPIERLSKESLIAAGYGESNAAFIMAIANGEICCIQRDPKYYALQAVTTVEFAACNHGLVFDIDACAVLDVHAVRAKYPRLCGACPLGCGFDGIAYASVAHYVFGDW